MPLPDVMTLAASSSLELVSPFISRITRAHTLVAVAQALAQTTPAHLISFDRCSLVIPAATAANHDDAQAPMRSLSVERGAERVSVGLFRATHSPFAQALERGVAVVLDETTLRDTAEITGHDARAALALPLTNGTETFGALCFTSATAGVYDDADTRTLAWLADAVALAVGACLSRERLESGNEARCELERLKSGFVNTLVRDIRLPLTNVLGLLELFESKLQAREPFDMEDRQLLGSAIEQGGRMRQLADNLLEVARQQEQTLALNTELTATERLLEDAVEPLRGEAALRGVELNVRVAAGTSDLHVDVRQTRRAISHLICVALAATPAGGSVRIEAQSIMGTRLGDEGQRFVVVNVADSGAGISPEEIPFVFDAFWHVSDARRTNAGRGIGLAIAKRIAAAHGGNVSVRSQLGAGTTYSIVLPAQRTPRKAERPARHILVVDDAPELLLLLGKLIERMGYRVTTAPNVARALETLDAQPVDLLITDWAMPAANGGELINAIKCDERRRHIPVVVLTGHDTDIERSAAHEAGCDCFLVKPIMRDELQRIISELLPVEVNGEQ